MADFPTIIGTSIQAGFALVKLRTAYAGSCLRIRRSSDNAEQDIGFDGDNVIDWAAVSAFIGGGSGFVRTWYDQSANANHAGQATTANQPALDVANTRINFDGSNDVLVTASNIGITGDAAVTGFCIGRSTADFREFFGFGVSGNEFSMERTGSGGTVAFSPNASAGSRQNFTTATNLGTRSLLSIVKAPGQINLNTTMFQDGAALSQTGTALTSTPNISAGTLKIGADGQGARFLTGSLECLIIVNSALGSTPRSDGEDWLLNDGWVPNPPDITTTSLPNGVVNTEYSETLAVTGGTGSITWSVTVGALPDGLSLNASTGEISGTPTVAGTFSFTVQAEDAATATDTQALSITIASTPPILGTDGNPYHKFAIPCSVKEYDESIGFSVLRNQLSDGYRSRTLYGSNTGLRGFKLTMPTLAGGTASGTVTGINGEEVTKEEYLWSLYCECESTGTPFVIESQRNNQYYLVEFANESLSYSRFLTKLYSTGVDLTQVRIDGVSVFQPSRVVGLFGYWDSDTAFDSNDWDGTDGTSTISFVKTGDVIDVAAAVNGHQIKRFNNTSNNGYVESAAIVETVYDIIIACKFREPTFSNDADVIGEGSGPTVLIAGDSGTTKFTDPSLTNFSYFLNGQEYASSNMQAPMNTWGICHFRNLDGWDVSNGLLIGGGIANFAEMDLGDIAVLNKPSMQTCREIVEQMMVKWL